MSWRLDGATGATLLLVRPLAGTMAHWGRFRDVLAERMRVLSFDAVGTGTSPGAPRRSTRAMAADARAVLDDVGVARVHVYGESLGGMVATWLAVDEPGRVHRLVLSSTLPRGTMIGLASSLRGARRLLGMVRCFAGDRHELARCLTRRVLSTRFRADHPDEARRIEDEIAAEGLSRRVALTHMLAAGRHDVSAELPRIAAPTLVLFGERDTLTTAASQRALLRAIPDVTFDVIADSGHAISDEQPEAAAARVLGFLA